MSTPKGYSSQEKDDRLKAQHVTVEPIRTKQHGMSVNANVYVYEVGTDAVEASSTTSVINATGHAALAGDIINFTTGALSGQEFKVSEVDTNEITIAEEMSVAPSAADAFQILRHKYAVVDSGGLITVTQGPIVFTRNGGDQEVTEDTGTPANNRPLPVKITGLDGDVVINSSNLNLAVQLDHDSANPDSVQVGDGTEVMAVNASNEAQVRDDDANTALTSISGQLPATLGQKAKADSLAVTLASDEDPLNTIPAGNVADNSADSGNPLKSEEFMKLRYLLMVTVIVLICIPLSMVGYLLKMTLPTQV